MSVTAQQHIALQSAMGRICLVNPARLQSRTGRLLIRKTFLLNGDKSQRRDAAADRSAMMMMMMQWCTRPSVDEDDF